MQGNECENTVSKMMAILCPPVLVLLGKWDQKPICEFKYYEICNSCKFILSIWLGHSFANATTAELPWHGLSCVLISSLFSCKNDNHCKIWIMGPKAVICDDARWGSLFHAYVDITRVVYGLGVVIGSFSSRSNGFNSKIRQLVKC